LQAARSGIANYLAFGGRLSRLCKNLFFCLEPVVESRARFIASLDAELVGSAPGNVGYLQRKFSWDFVASEYSSYIQ